MDTSFFSEMALELHNEPTAERTIERIAEFAMTATSCDDAGIMLVRGRNQIETAAATSSRVGESHNLQIIFDEGPCLDAIEGGPLYLVERRRRRPALAGVGTSGRRARHAQRAQHPARDAHAPLRIAQPLLRARSAHSMTTTSRSPRSS